jgi:hypothetical protein
MKPTLYTLQESKDGINFIDAKHFRTNATLTATNIDTLYNYIHRHRESNTTYYYRVKGTLGSANPIYSNVITRTYKLLSNYRKGVNYNNGTVWLMDNTSRSITEYRTGGKIRNVKKNAILPIYIASIPMGKYGDELIFENIKSTYTTDGHKQIIAYNTLTEAIRVVKTIEATDLYPSSGNKADVSFNSFIEGNLLYYVNQPGILRIINLDNGTMQSFDSGRVALDGPILNNFSGLYKKGNTIYYLPSRVTNSSNRLVFFMFNTTTQTWSNKQILNPNNITLTDWRVKPSPTQGEMFTNLVNNKFLSYPHASSTLVLELEIIDSTKDIRINTLLNTLTSANNQYLFGAYDTNGKFESGSFTLNNHLTINGSTVTTATMNGLSESTLAYDGNFIRTRQTLDAIITPSVNGTLVNPLDPEHNRM